MSFCKNCGTELNEDTKYCPSCGACVEEELEEKEVKCEEQRAQTDAILKDGLKLGIISVILAEIPIANIVGIVLGSKARKRLAQAEQIAKDNDFTLSGMRIPVKVLGIVGFALSIVTVIFYTLSFIIGVIGGILENL